MTEQTQIHTFESVWTSIVQVNESIKELRESIRDEKESIREQRESNREEKERIIEQRKNIERQAEIEKQSTAELKELIRRLYNDVKGIGRSNGSMAEEFFVLSLIRGELNFFGEKFTDVKIRLQAIDEDYNIIDEYDIVLINGDAICIVEVKYKAEEDDISEVLQIAVTFRKCFPKYANKKLYLGLAAMSFEKKTEKKCTKNGIAIIKQVGETFMVNGENVKVYWDYLRF